jgi:hypothetical protein
VLIPGKLPYFVLALACNHFHCISNFKGFYFFTIFINIILPNSAKDPVKLIYFNYFFTYPTSYPPANTKPHKDIAEKNFVCLISLLDGMKTSKFLSLPPYNPIIMLGRDKNFEVFLPLSQDIPKTKFKTEAVFVFVGQTFKEEIHESTNFKLLSFPLPA